MSKKEIAKSSALIQKELKLKEIGKQKEKTTKAIKTTKEKVLQIQTDAEAASKSAANMIFRMAELSTLAKEIKELEKTIRKTLKLKKQDKMELEMLTEGATLDDIIFQSKMMFNDMSFSEEDVMNREFNEEDQNQHTDEFNRQRRSDMFDQFTVKLDAEEQQSLRKVFIELASNFHPDKATNEQQAKFFHDIMQQVNAAYQRGDIDELLEVKKRFEHLSIAEAVEKGVNLPLLDVLDEQILRGEAELKMLAKQLERLKSELKDIKNSSFGALAKNEREAARYGEPSAKESEESTLFMTEMLGVLKDILNEWLTSGKKPDSLGAFLKGTHPILVKGQEKGYINFGDDDDDFQTLDMSEAEMNELLSAFSTMFEHAPKPRRKRK